MKKPQVTMTEQFLQYLWKNKLFQTDSLISSEGQEIIIQSPGQQSFDAGPDFINAKVKIGHTLWAGNVEVHIRSSDWFRHNHYLDKAYDNVVLHVVYQHDAEITRSNGTPIPVLELKFDEKILQRYTELQISPNKAACEQYLSTIDRFFIDNWLDNLLAERLNLKATNILMAFENNNHDLNETFYQLLLQNFGFKTNKQPMEQLSRKLPYKYILRHRDNLLSIEAMLFGQAGFLNEALDDDYYMKLQKEWNFLSTKFQLVPMEKHLWKFLRLRPANFPTIRLAQLAMLLYSQNDLLGFITHYTTNETLDEKFQSGVSEYWKTHYTFGRKSSSKEKPLGKEALDSIKINTLAPWLFFYGKLNNKQEYTDKAVNILEHTRAEKNTITNYWAAQKITPLHAGQSQALIQLTNEYCKPRGCLFCHIGNRIITSKTRI